MVAPDIAPRLDEGNPINFRGVWSPGWCNASMYKTVPWQIPEFIIVLIKCMISKNILGKRRHVIHKSQAAKTLWKAGKHQTEDQCFLQNKAIVNHWQEAEDGTMWWNRLGPHWAINSTWRQYGTNRACGWIRGRYGTLAEHEERVDRGGGGGRDAAVCKKESKNSLTAGQLKSSSSPRWGFLNRNLIQ